MEHTIGLLAGLATFAIICILFGLAAFFTIWRLKRVKRLQRSSMAEESGQLREYSDAERIMYESKSMDLNQVGIVNKSFSAMCEERRKAIAAKHFMKNGFHRRLETNSAAAPASTMKTNKKADTEDGESVANLKLLRTNSTPTERSQPPTTAEHEPSNRCVT